MKVYSIKELEIYTGVKAHTIRMWEKRYNLLEPERTETNIRLYSDFQLRHLLNVVSLLSSGLKISEIAKMTEDEIRKHLDDLQFGLEQTDYTVQINNMLKAMFDFDETKVHELYAQYVISVGLEDTLFKIFSPLLVRLGNMWSLGDLHPGHEHFMSHLMRQKIMEATEQLHPEQKREERVILFLPNNEYHDLGLLMANYHLRKNGFQVLYLGQSLTNSNVLKVNEEWKADYLICANPCTAHSHQLPKWLVELSLNFDGKAVLFGGCLNPKEKEQIPTKLKTLPTMDKMIGFFDKLSSESKEENQKLQVSQ